MHLSGVKNLLHTARSRSVRNAGLLELTGFQYLSATSDAKTRYHIAVRSSHSNAPARQRVLLILRKRVAPPLVANRNLAFHVFTLEVKGSISERVNHH